MADATVDELIRLFTRGPDQSLEPDVLAELQSTLRLHSLSPQELFFKWESYSMKMGLSEAQLDIGTARSLKQAVQGGIERDNRLKAGARTERRTGVTPRAGAGAGDVFDMLDGIVPKTPRIGSARASGSLQRRAGVYETPTRIKSDSMGNQGTPLSGNQSFETGRGITSFADRPNPGQTIEVLNDHLAHSETKPNAFPDSRIKLTAGSDIKKLSYKPMAMKLSEASEILDDRIDDFITFVRDHYGFEDSAFGNPASQNTSEIVAVGRISSDSMDGKLNKASMLLESSRRRGAGFRIPVNTAAVQNFQFFLGQIVALKGINSSGQEFTVSEVLDIPLLPVAASTSTTLEAHIERLRGGPDAMDTDADPQPLTVILAAGPYSADDNLDFEPLRALCSQAAETCADAMVLTGPFIDIDHPLIACGDFDLPEELMSDTSTLSTLFRHLISPIFHDLVAMNPHITVLLAPSVRDAISNHVSWPQEPLSRKSLNLPKEVKMIGNPMTVSINECVFGISSQDVLAHLRQAEVTGSRPKDPNALVRLSKYLIEQRHFFPLFPPVDRTNLPNTGTEEGIASGAVFDPSYLKLGEIINTRPDVLFIPSSLTPFAKVVENVVVVNPGFLSKRKASGSYARLTIHPPKLTTSDETASGMVGHNIFQRMRVDIVRI